MCVVGFATQTQTVPHTPLELISQIKKKRKEKKKTQRMWRPLCFHFKFEMKTKLKYKNGVFVREMLLKHLTHTHHKLVFKLKKKKKKKI